jgi:pyridoxine 5-phosphate synthase
MERTTEGGLDLVGQRQHLAPAIDALREGSIRVSLFIAAEPAQIETAAGLGAPVIEIHTGTWCDALAAGDRARANAEWRRIQEGARQARKLGLEVHAGHGLDYASAETISGLPDVVELNIGHYLVGEAIFTGLTETIRNMRAAMERGRMRAASAA